MAVRLSSSSSSASARKCAAGFAHLPTNLLYHILLVHLVWTDVSRLACSCRHLRLVCGDGKLWARIFERRFPQSRVAASQLGDWKRLLVLELQNSAEELVCFHTKLRASETVLGVGVTYTVNPVTRRADYMAPVSGLLSHDAFVETNVRRGMYNEGFEAWLPLYVDREHFSRALKRLLPNAIMGLCVHLPADARWSPVHILDVLPVLMNTLVVQLCDKGIEASDTTLDTFCRLHRLFYACCQQFSGLRAEVHRRLDDFKASASNRVKAKVPSLGNFCVLLSVVEGPGLAWRDVAPALVEESLHRSFLWAVNKAPELHSARATAGGPANMPRLTTYFDTQRVSLRLWMFHAAFLRCVVRPPGSRLGDVAMRHDLLFGTCTNDKKAQFKSLVRSILAVDSWPRFFMSVGLPVPTPVEMEQLLDRCREQSLAKGYHKANTDFAKVHRSGTSRLLLRGETLSCDTNLSRVVMAEVWHWSAGLTQYLDASCLVFDFDGQYLGVVDFLHTSSTRDMGAVGAICHSGDVLDYGKREGSHTIHVQLKQLSSRVGRLYFTMTGFHVPLVRIRQPYVRMTDEGNGVELCRYHVEDVVFRPDDTSIVMCGLVRRSLSAPWEVEAIGAVGTVANASNYGPLIAALRSRPLPPAKSVRPMGDGAGAGSGSGAGTV